MVSFPGALSATPTKFSLSSFTKSKTFPFPSSSRSSSRLTMACVPLAAAVSEFKGPNIFGVVRFSQISKENVRIEASFGGLSPGKHSLCINEYGDLTKGAASTGKIYNPLQDDHTATQLLGDLGTLEADKNGEALYKVKKEKMKVTDLIGRAVVVYETEDKSVQGITAAVVARSGEVGESCRKLCSCDGTTVWEATIY